MSEQPVESPSEEKISRSIIRKRQLVLRLKIFLSIMVLIAFIGWLLMSKSPHAEQVVQVSEGAVKAKQEVELPGDDAQHVARTEWWYYNGHMKGQSGKQYSFHYTLFLHRSLSDHSILHASFVDHDKGERFQFQRRFGGNLLKKQDDGFTFISQDWRMVGTDGLDHVVGLTDEFGFDLKLEQTAPVVLQGGTGLLDFDFAGTSYYYTRPRMKISGEVTVGNQHDVVTGEAWFDHQWGDFRATVMNWEWFAIQLEDGRDIMIYLLSDKQGKPILYSGTIAKDGETKVLDSRQFEAKPLAYWTSLETQVKYPVDWQIKIPGQKIDLLVKARRKASEFDARPTSYNSYWEGAVKVSGSHKGRGFLEVSKANAKDSSLDVEAKTTN